MRAYCNADYNSKTWNVLDSHSDHFQSRLQSVHSTHFDSRWRRCLPSSSLTTTLMSLFFSPDWLDLCVREREGVIFFSSLYPAVARQSSFPYLDWRNIISLLFCRRCCRCSESLLLFLLQVFFAGWLCYGFGVPAERLPLTTTMKALYCAFKLCIRT